MNSDLKLRGILVDNDSLLNFDSNTLNYTIHVPSNRKSLLDIQPVLSNKYQLAPADREDIINECKKRIAVLENYAPKMMDADEIKAIIAGVLADLGIENPTGKDKGKIMKELMPKVKGKADGKLVKEIVGSFMA